MPRKPPARTIFFIDRSLGRKQVVEALQATGAEVLAHDDVFPQNATDVQWLEACGAKGWVVLTKDSAIRRNPHERAMFQRSKVRMFALTRQGILGAEMAQIFAAALPGMLKRLSRTDPPFVFSISRKGEFTRLL